jgi:hypothetical protein
MMVKLLEDPDRAREDATLATYYLFGLFEVGFPPLKCLEVVVPDI